MRGRKYYAAYLLRYYIHCYVRHDNIAAVCITDEEFQARVAFNMLSRVLDDFSENIPAR